MYDLGDKINVHFHEYDYSGKIIAKNLSVGSYLLVPDQELEFTNGVFPLHVVLDIATTCGYYNFVLSDTLDSLDKDTIVVWAQPYEITGLICKSEDKSSGKYCKQCGLFYSWVENNQPNDEYICFNCRQ